MPKRTPNYVLVLALFIISCCVTYWARTRPQLVLVDADLKSLPTTIGAWTRDGADIDVGDEVRAGWSVTPDKFLNRPYIDRNGNRVTLMVVYKGRDRRAWHLSEMCYSGSGYDVSQGPTDIPYNGADVTAWKLVAEDKTTGTKDVAVYWFAQGDKTEVSFLKQQKDMALSRLSHSRYGWAFVRVTSSVVSSEDEALNTIRQFTKAASGPLVASLTGRQASTPSKTGNRK